MTTTTEQGTVLVVDDVEVNRILARAYLERLGWKVTDCDSGMGAFEYLSEHIPEAVLLDVRMPGMTGDDVARNIRNLYPDHPIRVVAYTAHCQPDELETIRRSGFDYVLVKPVSFQQMAEALRRT
jgi:CheY-like chemotaxis protein